MEIAKLSHTSNKIIEIINLLNKITVDLNCQYTTIRLNHLVFMHLFTTI